MKARGPLWRKRSVSRAPHAWRDWLIYAAVLIAATLVVFSQLVPDMSGRVYALNDDTSLFVWWFAHAADVVAGWFGQGGSETNFLYATSMNAPVGVNGGWNTTVLGLALPMVPVTWLWGPIVAYNLCIMAAPVVSALAASLFIRRFVGRVPAFVGGAAYGFSTYITAQAAGHLNLAFAPFPPLLALGLCALVASRRAKHTITIGLLLGCLIGWQFYMSTELLAGTFLATLSFLLCWAIFSFSTFAPGFRPLLAGGLTAVGVAVLIGLPLILTMATMPGAPRGAIRPHGVWNNDLLDPVVPGSFTAIGGGAWQIPRVLEIDPSEVGGYFGVVWLIFVVLTVIVAWRSRPLRPLLRVGVASGLLIFALSMGSPWLVDGRPVLTATPFRIVELMPVLRNALPMRLVVHVTLVMALLLALGVHLSLRSPRRWRRMTGVAGALAAIVMVTPGVVSTRALVIPDFYKGDYAQAIPAGARVKTLPRPIAYAVPRADEAMLWQAVTSMHYKETGGYFIGSTPTQPLIYEAPMDALDRVLQAHGGGSPAGDDLQLRGALESIAKAGTDFVVISPQAKFPPGDLVAISAAIAQSAGSEAKHIGGVDVIDLRGLR